MAILNPYAVYFTKKVTKTLDSIKTRKPYTELNSIELF